MSDVWGPPSGEPTGEPAGDRHPLPERGPWDSYGWQVQPPPAQSGTDGFAIAAIVLGILPVCAGILGIVFGFVSLNRIKTSRQGGRGLAITGIVTGGVWIAVFVTAAALGAFAEADRDTTGAISAPGSVDVTELRVGDCVNSIPEGTVYDLKAVPCGTAHLGEVYEVYDLAAGSYPGETRLDELVSKHCYSELPAFTGVPEARDGYEVYYLVPLKRSWYLDRGASCVVTADDRSVLTGSVRGKGARPKAPSGVAPGALRGELSIDDLEVGNCISSDTAAATAGTLDVVPCSEAHLSEVFSVYDLAAGAYPGDARVEALVVGHCRKYLPGFVRAPAGRTGYSVAYYWPDAGTWAAGDRRATCLLEDPDGDKLTAEARSKGRHT